MYYEVWNIPGLSIVGKKVSTEDIANATRSQAFYNWMCDQENTTAIFLLENLTESTPQRIVYDNIVDGKIKSSNFDGYNVSKAKTLRPGDSEVERHGRLYDKSRFIKLPGCEHEHFLVAVAWIHEEELRIFAAYPELLVVDAKANTNKYKKAFFAGVGVDGAYKNSVLFRTWIPNQTRDSYTWLVSTALPTLVPQWILDNIQIIMSDDCQTFGPLLRSQCVPEGTFPNAISLSCVYHIERNFFEAFGIGGRKLGLGVSSMQRKKGGEITWAHSWQGDLVGAIYRIQRCQSFEELEEAKIWVREFIDTCPDLNSGTLRNLVQTFFQLKIDIADRWVKVYRMGRPHFNIVSSSRIEGEFSWLWLLRLTSASTLCKAIVKMRWAADRRHHKKQKSIEDWLSTSLKRKHPDQMHAEDWAWLDKNMTPHHMSVIVKNILAADNYAFQLTGLSDTAIEFSVWRTNYEEEPAETDHAPAADAEEQNEDDVAAANIEADGLIGEDPDAAQEAVAPEGDFFFQGKRAVADGAQKSSEQPVRLEPFLYRYIRKVTLRKEGSHYVMSCTCTNCEAVCSPCAHMFLIFGHVAPTLRLCQLKWHPRTTKSHYFNALFEEAMVPLRQLVHTVVGATAHPRIESSLVENWLLRNTDAPSTEGVPPAGRLSADFEHFDDNDGEVGAASTSKSKSKQAASIRRPAAPDKVAADHLHWQITECLGKQHAVYKEYSAHLESFRDDLVRRGIETAGPGKHNRQKAYYEGDGKTKKQKQEAAAKPAAARTNPAATHQPVALPYRTPATAPHNPQEENGGDDGFEGMTGENARNILLEYGPDKGDIVELFPDAQGKRVGDRWFMIVKNPELIQVNGKTSIKLCRWCKTNSLQPCTTWKDLTHCHIENVTAWGVPTATIFKNLPVAASIRTPTSSSAVPVTAASSTIASVQQQSAAVPILPVKRGAVPAPPARSTKQLIHAVHSISTYTPEQQVEYLALVEKSLAEADKRQASKKQ